MKIFLMAVLTFSLASVNVYAETHKVSNKALNSITCPSGLKVTDVFASEKSKLKLELRGDKIFFEFMADKVDVDGYVSTLYTIEPTTIAVFCGDDEYSINLVPKNIDAGTTILLPAQESASPVLVDGLAREEQLAKVVQMILSDDIKSLKSVASGEVAMIGDVEVHLRKIYTVGKYRIKELYTYAKYDTRLTEGELLALPFVNYPIAITVPQDSSAGWQRHIVIEEVQK